MQRLHEVGTTRLSGWVIKFNQEWCGALDPIRLRRWY